MRGANSRWSLLSFTWKHLVIHNPLGKRMSKKPRRQKTSVKVLEEIKFESTLLRNGIFSTTSEDRLAQIYDFSLKTEDRGESEGQLEYEILSIYSCAECNMHEGSNNKEHRYSSSSSSTPSTSSSSSSYQGSGDSVEGGVYCPQGSKRSRGNTIRSRRSRSRGSTSTSRSRSRSRNRKRTASDSDTTVNCKEGSRSGSSSERRSSRSGSRSRSSRSGSRSRRSRSRSTENSANGISRREGFRSWNMSYMLATSCSSLLDRGLDTRSPADMASCGLGTLHLASVSGELLAASTPVQQSAPGLTGEELSQDVSRADSPLHLTLSARSKAVLYKAARRAGRALLTALALLLAAVL